MNTNMTTHIPHTTFDKIFKEKSGHFIHTLATYQHIYDLAPIAGTFPVSKEQFAYISQKHHFVLLCLYDEEKRIFLSKNIHKREGRELPGGSILPNEDMHNAVKRIANTLKENILLGEIEPVCTIENTFTYQDKKHTHLGIALIARVRNTERSKENPTEYHSGKFVDIDDHELHNIASFTNKEVVHRCKRRLQEITTKFPEREIAINEAQKRRYWFHNACIKKTLLHPRFRKKQAFTNLLLEKIEKTNQVENTQSFIDVSCGDNSFVYQVAQKLPENSYIVGNDISRSQVDLIANTPNTNTQKDTKQERKQQNNTENIFFTNHNAVHLPFKENSFDIAFCSNTLHHMNSREELCLLFKSLIKIAKKIIFVEIEDPKQS